MLLGYNIYRGKLESLNLMRVKIISTINPHSYCISKKDPLFEKALQQSDILLPDGVGIVLAARFLKSTKIKRIAGYDVFIHLMKHLNDSKGSCFFLGSSQHTLDLILKRAKIDFPNVSVNYYSPPFKEKFSESDSQNMCKAINKFNPEVLFVGMTAPKQEKWVYQYQDQINANVICSIGAVFDFYAETVKRPVQFWINLGLEWLPRFLKDPKRLAERNLISTPKFILEIISLKLFNKGIL